MSTCCAPWSAAEPAGWVPRPAKPGGLPYYLCRGHTDALRAAQGQRCTARYIPAGQLDELVWADLCALLTDPAQARPRAGPGTERRLAAPRTPGPPATMARPSASCNASSNGCWTPTSPRWSPCRS